MTTSAQAIMPPVRRDVRESTDVGGLLSILIRHKGKVLTTTLAGLALALAYLAVAKPLYTASTTLFIDPRSRKVVTDDVVQGGLGSDVALVESQVAIIGSDGVLRRVVDKLVLHQDQEFAPPPGQGMLSQLKAMVVPRPAPPDPHVQAITTLSQALKVKRAQKTYVVDVEVSASSPVKAARITEAVVDAYLADQTAAKMAEARRANAMIDARLGELREQVRKAETRVDEFKKANRILTSEGGLVNEQQLSRLNGELGTARGVAAEAKARHDQITSALKAGVSPDTLPDAIRSSLIQRLREQYAQVARREAALSSQLQARHPVLIEVRSQLNEIRAQIGAELKRIQASARSEYEMATNREKEISRTLDRSKDEVSRTNTAQIKLRELEQEVNASRELLRLFLARAKETQEQQNIATNDARVISPATVPTRPSRPVGWLVLGLGLLGGLGLGLARALVSDHLDPSVHSAADVTQSAGLRAAATIPALVGLGPGPANLWHFKKPRLGDGTSPYSDLMTALSDTRSQTASSYRQGVLRLLGRLRSAATPGRAMVVLVAAPNSGSGGSATALGVAYAAALRGERVLLVDAASADASLSLVFANGLKQDRVVMLDNREHLAGITIRDSRSGLAFLPLALADLRQLKTTQRQRLLNGLQALAQGYDLVVIDAGAVLEDEASAYLSALSDQILLVARVGHTPRSMIADAAQLFEPARDRLAGVVLTMAPSAGA